MDNRGDWFGLIAIIISAVVGLGGYLARPTFVPAGRAKELREQIAEMRVEISELRRQNEELNQRVRDLMSECEFWREQYRTARSHRRMEDR